VSEPIEAAKSEARPQLPRLGFFASLILVVASLFAARMTVTALGFTGHRLFSDGMIWWQVLLYFVIAVGYYSIASVAVNWWRWRKLTSASQQQ
jgi:uncharacterized membrane protein